MNLKNTNTRFFKRNLCGALVMASLTAFASHSVSAQINSNADFQTAVQKRFANDLTGLCVAAALIQDRGNSVYKTTTCADPARAQQLTDESTFEIGSISKTMLAALVADLIDQGKMKLSDPLQQHLPAGAVVPAMNGKVITIQHVVTHTSGLPPLPADMSGGNPENPYAALTPNHLLASLKTTTLQAEPGTQHAYSNFAMMVLSLAVTNVAKEDLDTLMRRRLFDPLGMKLAYIGKPAKTVKTVQGHDTQRRAVSAWTINTDLAGVGMVRASLDDMIAYARAGMGSPISKSADATRVADLIATAQKSIYKSAGAADQNTEPIDIGMNWFNQTLAGGKKISQHGGGTGGFSSYIAIDRDNGRAVIILSDTGAGGIGRFANSLIDSKEDGGKARLIVKPDPVELEKMAGDYLLQNAVPTKLRVNKGKLTVQVEGQQEFETGYDSNGDFFVSEVDAVLRPAKSAKGYRFTLLQAGAAVPLTRVDESKVAPPAKTIAVDAKKLKDYEGIYPLFPGLKLRVFAQGDSLMAQATGQGAFQVVAEADDYFTANAFNIKLTFKRGTDGKVASLRFQQGPNDVSANRE